MRKLAVLLMLFSACAPLCLAQTVDPKFKKIVTFVFGRTHLRQPNGALAVDADGHPVVLDGPLGTAFFVLYPDERIGKNGGFGYLVTARHVLQDADGSFLKTVRIRLNLRNATPQSQVDFIELPVSDAHGNLLWLQDPANSSTDIAVLPFLPSQERFDLLGFPVELFVSNESLTKDRITEGDSIFFVGLMPQFYGQTKNYPVVRKGSIALLTDEALDTPTGQQHCYIAELSTWPGNSGSPVFVNLSGMRGGGLILGGGPELLGIVLGSYLNSRSAELIETTRVAISDKANIGLGFLLPAPVIRRVLDSPLATALREKEVKRLQGRNPLSK